MTIRGEPDSRRDRHTACAHLGIEPQSLFLCRTTVHHSCALSPELKGPHFDMSRCHPLSVLGTLWSTMRRVEHTSYPMSIVNVHATVMGRLLTNHMLLTLTPYAAATIYVSPTTWRRCMSTSLPLALSCRRFPFRLSVYGLSVCL